MTGGGVNARHPSVVAWLEDQRAFPPAPLLLASYLVDRLTGSDPHLERTALALAEKLADRPLLMASDCVTIPVTDLVGDIRESIRGSLKECDMALSAKLASGWRTLLPGDQEYERYIETAAKRLAQRWVTEQ